MAKLRPSKHDLHHIIFAFNRHDARALESSAAFRKRNCPPDKAPKEPGDQIGTDPKTEQSQKELDRDVAYRIAVRGAMELIRKELNAKSLRWTATMHRPSTISFTSSSPPADMTRGRLKGGPVPKAGLSPDREGVKTARVPEWDYPAMPKMELPRNQ